jgi:hypothetical protein
MKTSNIALMLFCLIGLTGCPIPAYYTIFDRDDTGNEMFKGAGYELDITAASPWLDHQKKVVIINARIKNTIAADAVFSFSAASLGANTDTFLLNRTRRDLNNKNYINEKDTAQLKPGEQREILFFFLSTNNYSRSEYNKSIESDTLRFRIAGVSKVVPLVGKRNR